MIKILFTILITLFILPPSCPEASGGMITKVVVSIYPLKEMVEQVGGEKVRVDFIVPAGASPHTFEPKPSDIKKLNQAEVLFLIGGGFEFWAEKVISTLNKRPRVVILSEGLPLLKEEGEEHFDPHIWLDPVMVMTMVDKIRDTLINTDPLNKAYYMQRAERFKGEIKSLDSRIKESVRRFSRKEFVTFHSAWNYFSKRYGLRVIGVIEESPGKEASPAHIARIIDALKKTGSRVVMVEPQFSPKAAEVIAKETGARVFVLDPLGNPHTKGRDSYIGLMNYNLSILEKALR
jgi:zinc transport system substrate-binding protein